MRILVGTTLLTIAVLITSISSSGAYQETSIRQYEWNPVTDDLTVLMADEIRLYTEELVYINDINLPVDWTEFQNAKISWNPNGVDLALISETSEGVLIQIWNTNTLQLVGELGPSFENFYAQFEWSPTGNRFAVISSDISQNSVVRVYQTADLTLLSEFNPIPPSTMQEIKWNPKTDMLAIGLGTSLYLWDVGSGQILAELPRSYITEASMDFCHDGEKLATVRSTTAEDLTEVTIYNLSNYQVELTLTNHTYDIDNISWGETSLATQSLGDSLIIWDSDLSQSIWNVNTGLVKNLLWFPDGSRVLIDMNSQQDLVLDMATGTLSDLQLD